MNGDHTPAYLTALAFLAAAVVFVPIAKRLGLGAVLGYLIAGVLLGPSLIGITREPEEIVEFAELGVVFLLFLIGLELNPHRLWAMRRDIFGLGLLQVVLCAGLIMTYPLLIGENWHTAVVAGLGLALSSTALVMQLIEERGSMRLPYGQKSFAILLMQDLAIVPLLLIVALLAPGESMDGDDVAFSIVTALAAVGGVVVIGHYLLSPMFRVLARFGGTEIMTAATLLVVLASATAMMAVGLSMAMGAFLAGVMLAESNYRHELEADIEPFRGLLLGLFFLAVGMTIDLGLIWDHWPTIVGGLITMIIFKSLMIYGLVRLFGGDHATATKTGLLLSQGGEFGFVLYTAAERRGLISADNASLLIAVVTISMVTTPFLIRFLAPRLIPKKPAPTMTENYDDADGDILIIGFGRFGQLVSQMFLAGGYRPIILDNDAERVTEARRFGSRVYYGEGARLDVLRSVGAHRCRLIAVCTSPADHTNAIVGLIKEQFPGVKVFARAFDRRHALTLLGTGVDYQRRETIDSAIRFGRDALVELGLEPSLASETEELVRKRDSERLDFQRLEGLVEGHRKWAQVTPEPFTNLAPGDDGDAPALPDPNKKEAAE
ncbi:potassium transporter TrkA [Acuticoccus sediminis]|uniref:Potassium transporter TrkA n=1 Tax=Acuticoccus sediminis TaxID=2184697 RepID=A0A8B2NVD7_9HYPH|nr:monovalent cation:proton antiporter-2 (CPA2) family protein [Acuticoccus sediminis]RAI03323.1 potassium transporter TrkA [Acuticoccus sediminis]